MKLTKKQNNAIFYLKDQTTSELLFGGGVSGGKSALGCLWLIEGCQKYPGTRWLMGRSKLKTLKETTLNTFFDLTSKFAIQDQYNYNAQSHTIKFHNGSEIILKDLFLYPSDPNFDDLGSLEITGAFIDEVNQITRKAKDVVKSRIRYRLEEFKLKAKLLMTCNPTKNWVMQDYYTPYVTGTLPPYRRFIQSLIDDNPHTTKDYKDNLKTLDENSKQRLLHGNWNYDNDPSKLMDFNVIEDLWTNDHIKEENEPKYMTIDPARLGADKAVIMVWQGWKIINITTVDKSTLDELGRTIELIKNKHGIPHSKIVADADGLGAGLVDFLGIEGFNNGGSVYNGENYQNLKTQCYYYLADKVNQAGLYIATHEKQTQIKEELEQVKSFKADHDGKLRILPKEQIKENIGRSPDYSDCIMMRFYFEFDGAQTGYVDF